MVQGNNDVRVAPNALPTLTPTELRAAFDAWHARRMNHPDYVSATDKERAWLAVADFALRPDGVDSARARKATDAEVLEWAKRHDLDCWDNIATARQAFEDAETHHLTRTDGVTTTPRAVSNAWNSVRSEARALGGFRGLGDLLAAVEVYADARVAEALLWRGLVEGTNHE
jgi:hypothetical protein